MPERAKKEKRELIEGTFLTIVKIV